MRIVILEDEIPAFDRLQKLLLDLDLDIELVAHFDLVSEAIPFLREKQHFDLLITDIELGDGLCFEIFKHVEIDIPVIFTTAYDHYAIRAFEANAIDYLLKPLKKHELSNAIQRFEKRIGKSDKSIDYLKLATAILEEKQVAEQRQVIRYGQKMILVDLNNAAFYYSSHKSSFMMTKEGKTFPLDDSLHKIEARLDQRRFFRANRKCIINIDHIDEMISFGKGRIRLKMTPSLVDKDHGVISVERTPDFRKWIEGS